MPTLNWLIQESSLNNLRLITGENHILKEIKSVNVLDNPDVLKKMFPSEFPDKYYHHVTLRFRPVSKPSFNGRKTSVRIMSLHKDQFGYAAKVEIDDTEVAKYCENKYPHITFATESNVKPVYSNILIKNSEAELLKDSIVLNGTVGSFIDGHWDFSK